MFLSWYMGPIAGPHLLTSAPPGGNTLAQSVYGWKYEATNITLPYAGNFPTDNTEQAIVAVENFLYTNVGYDTAPMPGDCLIGVNNGTELKFWYANQGSNFFIDHAPWTITKPAGSAAAKRMFLACNQWSSTITYNTYFIAYGCTVFKTIDGFNNVTPLIQKTDGANGNFIMAMASAYDTTDKYLYVAWYGYDRADSISFFTVVNPIDDNPTIKKVTIDIPNLSTQTFDYQYQLYSYGHFMAGPGIMSFVAPQNENSLQYGLPSYSFATIQTRDFGDTWQNNFMEDAVALTTNYYTNGIEPFQIPSGFVPGVGPRSTRVILGPNNHSLGVMSSDGGPIRTMSDWGSPETDKGLHGSYLFYYFPTKQWLSFSVNSGYRTVSWDMNTFYDVTGNGIDNSYNMPVPTFGANDIMLQRGIHYLPYYEDSWMDESSTLTIHKMYPLIREAYKNMDPNIVPSDTPENTNTTKATAMAVTVPYDNESFSIGPQQILWYSVDLVAGTSYLFTTKDVAGNSSDSFDTNICLFDATGDIVLQNDDEDLNSSLYNSRMVYTPTANGTFYLAVTMYGVTYSNGFGFTASTNNDTNVGQLHISETA